MVLISGRFTPEYIDSEANGRLMSHQLKTMFGDGLHTLEHFEAAYEPLRSSNFLALNKTAVAKQQKAAAPARAEAERSRNVALGEDELYSMDMDELRMRGLGVWNK
jgi:hypothetical protein